MAIIAITAWQDRQSGLVPQLAALLSRQMPRHQIVHLDLLAYPQQRAAVIDAASLLIVVMGREWPATPPNILMNDPVSMEIAYAINRPYPKPIIPILPPGMMMPQTHLFPPHLQPFAYFQSIMLSEGVTLEEEASRVHTEIQTSFRKQWQAVRDRGNYLWFKILSWSAVVFFGLFALAGYIFGNNPVGVASVLLFLLDLLFFSSILTLWIAGTVIAIVTRRPGWAVINGLTVPLAVASLLSLDLAVVHNLPQVLQIILGAVIAVILFVGLFVWPIIFGVNLPPYRKTR